MTNSDEESAMTDEIAIEVAAEVAAIEEQRARRGIVWTLTALGTVVLILSSLNTWVERQLLDTNSWVDASTALLEDDDVREELSARLVNALYESVEVGEAIDEQLPEELRGLGGPLAGVLRDPLTDTADALLQSGPVRATWKEANRTAHELVVAVLEDDVADNISTADGKVVIDLGAVVQQLGEQIGLPQGVLDAIPEDAGVFEVVDSEELEAAQSAVKLIRALSIVFFVLVLALYGAAIYLASNWRRAAIRNVGFAIALGGFIVLVALRLGVGVLAEAPDTEGARAATSSVLAIGTFLLRQMAWSQILIGLLIALGASLVGPTRYAQRARFYTAKGFRRSAAATWVGFAVLVLVLLAWSPFSARGNWLTALILLALVVVGIEAIRRTSLAEEATRIEHEAKAEQAETELVTAGDRP